MSSLQTKITICESIIAYDFTDEVLCAKALSAYAACVTIQGQTRNLQHNSHMAVYGDAVSASYLCRTWLDSGLDSQWTAIRECVLGNANLAAVGFCHNLDRCVLLNPGTTAVSDKTMATTVEAILGAVHVDGGNAALGLVMVKLGLTHALLDVVTYNFYLILGR
ncbi:hypothetical protein P152DRAFT_324198 [Eremomyces bilateralis CBS 781.70]|uniref:RNase III domain-containing protein n=1 Tax=Eremomyces bilateralis CBS 781.70 TaxID=1392243 RepID=A0A6G1FPV8_9PEZI|nr:uncharacterized protein P152DRAFT_324198 [Eremomyces bilateralis CBS 781.70]KAF1807834.1 hypothetical protein P152DRAFT_324198 [Eremomyces bilateralis CBS 781.70]